MSQGAPPKRKHNGKMLACEVCGKEFYVRPSRIKKGAKFCSPLCAATATHRKHEKIKKACPICGKEFETTTSPTQGTTYCSDACARKSRRGKRQTSESIAKGIATRLKNEKEKHKNDPRYFSKHDVVMRICPHCEQQFRVPHSNKDQVFCSHNCAGAHHKHSEETLAKMCAAQQKRVLEGRHKGFPERNKLKPSYPEEFAIAGLSDLCGDLQLEYVRELKIGRWFVDFAFPSYKIAIEIDGDQHRLPERQATDKTKDAFLSKEGWKVFRIPCSLSKTRVNSAKGKKTLEKILDEKTELLRALALILSRETNKVLPAAYDDLFSHH